MDEMQRTAKGAFVLALLLGLGVMILYFSLDPRDCDQLVRELPANRLPDQCWR